MTPEKHTKEIDRNLITSPKGYRDLDSPLEFKGIADGFAVLKDMRELVDEGANGANGLGALMAKTPRLASLGNGKRGLLQWGDLEEQILSGRKFRKPAD